MDARDPLTSSPAAEDEDAAALAKEAAGLFRSRRFSECIDVLTQLLQKKEDDPKVLHNIAISEYFRDGCTDPRKLLDVLSKIKKKTEDLARILGEQMEVPSSSGDNVTGIIVSAHKFNTSIVTMNIAVTLYLLHEYERALSVLEPLYHNTESIDEAIALHACLLLLDTSFALQDGPKAADVIQYLERSSCLGFVISQGDDGISAQNQCSNQTSKASAAMSTIAVQDISSSDAGASANVPDSPLEKILSDEALEYETLISKLDSSASNLERPVSDDLSRTKTLVQGTFEVDLKLSLQLYRVRLLLLTRNLKIAKREIKLAMNMARGRDLSAPLLLKGQLEYAGGNYRKAIKLLMTLGSRTEPGILSMLNNNLGCIFYRLGKHHTSSVFFCKALRISSSLRLEKPLKLPTFTQDKSHYILYNCGLQQLDCGKPLDAARCFYKAAPFFYNRPLLWLRFAECCLLAQEKGLLRLNAGPLSGEDAKIHVVSSGKWRQVVVEDVNKLNMHVDSMGKDGIFGPDEQCRLSLPFARQCLLNALHVLNKSESEISCIGVWSSTSEEDSVKMSCHRNTAGKEPRVISTSPLGNSKDDPKDTKVSTCSNTSFQNEVLAYKDVCRKEEHMVMQAILADLAYVELSLENPLKALSFARKLEQLPDCSKIYLYLSHVYAAEALCYLNRPEEAAEQLSVYISDGNNMGLPYSDEAGEPQRVDKVEVDEELNIFLETQNTVFMRPEEARGAVSLNFAIIAALQGNIERASQFLMGALSSLPNNPRASLTAVYVDLLRGDTEDALTRLKQCSRVRYYPADVTLSSS